MKKKTIKKVYVKNPSIGQKYWFTFAGSISKGNIISDCEKLTKHYGSPYFMIEANGLKYPVSAFMLRHNKSDFESLK